MLLGRLDTAQPEQDGGALRVAQQVLRALPRGGAGAELLAEAALGDAQGSV